MPSYQIAINMSDETIRLLAEGGFSLYGLKAVRTTGSGGRPLVWFRSDAFSQTTLVSWTTSFQAYSSRSEIVPNRQIVPSARYDIGPGQTFTITDQTGIGKVTQDSEPGGIAVHNDAEQRFACGIFQSVGTGSGPVCAVPVFSGYVSLFQPVEKVFLIFSATLMSPGTVLTKSYSPGVLVDLAGVPGNVRSVTYDVDRRWSWGSGTGARSVPAGTDLGPLLVESSFSLEAGRPALMTRIAP